MQTIEVTKQALKATETLLTKPRRRLLNSDTPFGDGINKQGNW